jgi:maltokinase
VTHLPVRFGPRGWSVEVHEGQSAALVAALAAGEPLFWEDAGRRVALHGTWHGGHPPAQPTERAVTVDQTQQSVIVGEDPDAIVVKWTVEPTRDSSPAPLLTRHLVEVGFQEQPRPRGELRTSDGQLLAFLTSYLPGAQDGWDWYVEDVRARARGREVDVLRPADELGRLTARLHLAFATRSQVFPHPRYTADAKTTEGWRIRAEAVLDEAIAVTGGVEGERLQTLASAARNALAAIAVQGTPVQPIHGDLHVGQVLRWSGGYAVNDFDGNPVLPPRERLTNQPVARDVAGMLQSLDHVGRVALRHGPDADPHAVETWIREAQQRFLETYRRVLAEHNRSELLDERLLRAFAVEQECREYVYAARHLPRWLYVPDAALPALLDADLD